MFIIKTRVVVSIWQYNGTQNRWRGFDSFTTRKVKKTRKYLVFWVKIESRTATAGAGSQDFSAENTWPKCTHISFTTRKAKDEIFFSSF